MHARAGENEAALTVVERSLANMNDGSGTAWEAELHRQRAQLVSALCPSKVGEAETHLNRSIDVARRQGARSLELRAVTTLAECWRMQGKSEQIRALLDPVCLSFAEGIDTADLRRARTALGAAMAE